MFPQTTKNSRASCASSKSSSSGRSSSSEAPSPCRHVIKTSEQIADNEKRLNYVHCQLTSLEECIVDCEQKEHTIRPLVTWALGHFNAIEQLKNDERMLMLWKLLGKYSTNMGMNGVWENVYRLGLFRSSTQFYAIWAEHWATQGQWANFDKTVGLCEQHCHLGPEESQHLFGPLRFRYYSTEGNNSSSADQTMELMQQLASAPGIVRSEQTLFLHRQQQQKEKEQQQKEEQQQHKKAAISSTTTTLTTTPVSSSTSVWPKTNAAVQVQLDENEQQQQLLLKQLPQLLRIGTNIRRAEQPQQPGQQQMAKNNNSNNSFMNKSNHNNKEVNKKNTNKTSSRDEKENSSSSNNNMEISPWAPREDSGARKQFNTSKQFNSSDNSKQFNTSVNSKLFDAFKQFNSSDNSKQFNTSVNSKLFDAFKQFNSSDNSKQFNTSVNSKLFDAFKQFNSSDNSKQFNALVNYGANVPTKAAASTAPSLDSTPKGAAILPVVAAGHRQQQAFPNQQQQQSQQTQRFTNNARSNNKISSNNNSKQKTPHNSSNNNKSNNSLVRARAVPFPAAVAATVAVGSSFQSPSPFRKKTRLGPLGPTAAAAAGSVQSPLSFNSSKGKTMSSNVENQPLVRAMEKENLPTTPCECQPASPAAQQMEVDNDTTDPKMMATTEPKTTAIVSSASAVEEEAEDQCDDARDESTHLEGVGEQIPPGTLNPWDEQLRRRVMESEGAMRRQEYLHESLEKCPRVDANRTITLGTEQFVVERLLGEGGFARVFKAKVVGNDKHYAIKYEAPACPWEVYICSQLKRRVRAHFLQCIMEVRNAFVFTNASAIVYDFYPHGTLLDLGNLYKRNGAEMGGLLATFFAIQLGRVLEQVHAANIIHADVKPDNVVLTVGSLDERRPLGQLLQKPVLRLIDWGRSIDMDQFPGEQQFVGRAGTENFDCVEMVAGLPWTFQADFYGFAASIYVLLKGEYLAVCKLRGRNGPTKALKRRQALSELWTRLLDQLLNIASCQALPNWADLNQQMESELRAQAAVQLALEWRKALERFNIYMKKH